MRTKNMLLIIMYFSLFRSGYTQLIHPFEGIGKIILFADTLNGKNQIDWHIDRIKNEINSDKLNNLDLKLKYYNLAICYSAKKQIDSTCYYLSKCIDQSSVYNNLVFTDTDFDFLHQTPCWGTLVQQIDSAYVKNFTGITNKELAVELYHIFLKDQHARGLGLKKIDKNLINLDIENLKRVEEIIQEYGWPTFSMVGKTAAEGAFLVVQHSSTPIQQKYFIQLINAAKKNEASKESVALLLDRISVHNKGIQMFGTQVYQVKDSITGQPSKYKYFPIKDEEKVDSMRKAFDMIPLKEYYARFGIDYKPVVK